MRQNLEPELKYIPRHQGSLFLIVIPATDIELGLYNKLMRAQLQFLYDIISTLLP